MKRLRTRISRAWWLVRRLWYLKPWHPFRFHRRYLAHRYTGVYCRGCFRPVPSPLLSDAWQYDGLMVLMESPDRPSYPRLRSWRCDCGVGQIDRSADPQGPQRFENLFFMSGDGGSFLHPAHHHATGVRQPPSEHPQRPGARETGGA